MGLGRVLRSKLAPLAGSLRHRDFRFLWGAQILSELGDWAARIALALLVYERTNDKALTAMVMVVGMLPWLGLGQALSTLSDRYPRRTVMVVCDLLRGAIFLGMPLVESEWFMIALAFVAAAATPPFEAARAAVLPGIVPEEDYGDALALSNITFQSGLIVGYLTGGGLVVLLGAERALLVNGATFLLSGWLLWQIAGGRARTSAETIRASLRGAFDVLRADPFLRRAAILATVCASSAMVGEALVPVYAKSHLRAGDGVVGALAAAIPVGSVISSALVPRKGDHAMLLRASATTALVGCTLAFILFSVDGGMLTAPLAYACLGITFGLVVPAYNVLGSRLPEQVRATAFSILQGFLLGGQALASIAGGLLAKSIGSLGATTIALLPGIGFALYAIAVAPREPADEVA